MNWDDPEPSERGAATTELVIAIPALLLMVLLIVQFAVYEHARHIAQAVAAQAVTTARVENATAAAGQSAGSDLLAQLGSTVLARAVVDVQRNPERVTVTVTGVVESVVPGLALPLSVRDDGPVERLTVANQAAAGG